MDATRNWFGSAAIAALLTLASFACGATKLDETITGTVANILNRTGLPTTVAVGDSFIAHIFIDTDIAPPAGGGGTFTRVWNDSSVGQSGGGPQWLEFTVSFNGTTFFDSRTSGYIDGDNRVQKTLDQPNAVINGQQAFTDGYVVSSQKRSTDGNRGIIFLDTVTRSLLHDHYFATFDLGEAFNAPSDLALDLFNLTTGPIGRNLNVGMTVSSLSALAVGGIPPVPEPSTAFLMLAGVGLLLRKTVMARQAR